MDEFDLSVRECYSEPWGHVLKGWLGWDEERFQSWIDIWEYKSVRDPFFDHEDEWYWILGLLVPDELANKLVKRHLKQRLSNDLEYLWDEELHGAICGRPTHPTVRTPEFDWDAAKERARKVLQSYGYDLPQPGEVTEYEKRIRNESHRKGNTA